MTLSVRTEFLSGTCVLGVGTTRMSIAVWWNVREGKGVPFVLVTHGRHVFQLCLRKRGLVAPAFFAYFSSSVAQTT